MPALKEFLKGGEAESYRNVEIEFVKGMEPVMTLYVGGEAKEEIRLREYDTKEVLHELFQEKGLQKKSEEELAAMGLEQNQDEKREQMVKKRQALKEEAIKKLYERKKIKEPVPKEQEAAQKVESEL